MKNENIIEFIKWNKKDVSKLYTSISSTLNISSLQFYMPFFSLYYYIHNKPNANKRVDLKKKYEVREILDITKQRYYNSNMFLKSEIYDYGKNIYETKEIFCKTIPIIDCVHCMNNNYNFVTNTNHFLPSAYNYNTFYKINNIDNMAYIDVLCYYLFSSLTINNKLPSFALYYGSVNGLGNYNYEITDDYDDLKLDKCFRDNVNKGFELDVYHSDSDSDSDNNDDDNNSMSSDYNPDEYIAVLKNIPVQLLFLEKLTGTLEDIIDNEFDDNLILSCLFQIAFSLTYLQKHFNFSHNDLHINNIMYSECKTDYLYYKFNNKYFKVPTYGKIFKIIDFGRSIITYNDKVYMNDVYSKNGEAHGQYDYPEQVNFLKKSQNIDISQSSPYFDLCRLAMTILDETDKDNYTNINLYNLLNYMCTNIDKQNFLDMPDNFDLYINICKTARNTLPADIITHEIFNQYRISKKKFPRKSYYSLS